MATPTDIKIGSIIEMSNEIFEIIEAQHHRMAQGRAMIKTRIRSLETGKVLSKTIQGNTIFKFADVSRSKAQYLYADQEGLHFMNNDTFDQFAIKAEKLGDKAKYLKEGDTVTVLYAKERPLSVELPIKITLKVISAPPGIKGDTAQGATKEIETETGLKIPAPLFIKEGDLIRINTETGLYVERASS